MRTKRLGRTEGWAPGTRWSVAALALALLFVLARVLVPDLFMRSVGPVLGAGGSLSASAAGFFSSFGDARALAEKNAELARQNAALALENRMLGERLADLKALSGTAPAVESARGIVAGVLARPPTTLYDTLVLSAGTDAGVYPLMGVLGAGGVPLGTVSEVGAHTSRARLFSAPGVATDAWVGSARIPVTLEGAGAGSFRASVSQGTGISEGDTVYLPGPGAIPMGRVARIAGAASDPVVRLSIAPFINPFSVTWVLLVDVGTSWQTSSTPAP